MSETADSEEIDVEIRRNGSGSVLAYADRDHAEEAFDNHRAVLRSLYDLVDRRHGENGETVARLEVRSDGLGEILVRDEYVRDIQTDRALAVADDMRYHADARELVTDGGEKVDGEIDRCGCCGTPASETNLGWSEKREEEVCVKCVIYLEDNGHYPDEDGPKRDVTATYEVGA